MIIVPTNTPVSGWYAIFGDGRNGSGAYSHAEVAYDDVRVPQSNRLGALGAGLPSRRNGLAPDVSITVCAGWAFASVRLT